MQRHGPPVCFASTSGTTAPEPEEMDVFYLTSPSSAAPYGSVVHEGPPALLGRRLRVRLGCAEVVVGAILLVRPYLLPHLLVVRVCRQAECWKHGGRCSDGGALDPVRGGWKPLESSQRESAGFFHPRSERRLGSVWKKRRLRFTISLFINSIATSSKCLAGKVIKTYRNYN
jgi:hypothetical protein